VLWLPLSWSKLWYLRKSLQTADWTAPTDVIIAALGGVVDHKTIEKNNDSASIQPLENPVGLRLIFHII
jgi:hypothetical protein